MASLALSACGGAASGLSATSTTSSTTTIPGEIVNFSSIANYKSLTSWGNYSFNAIGTTGVGSSITGDVYDSSNYQIRELNNKTMTTVVNSQAFESVSGAIVPIKLPADYLATLGVGGSARVFINNMKSPGEYLEKGGKCSVAGRLGKLYLQENSTKSVHLSAQACIDTQTGGLLSFKAGLGGVTNPQAVTYLFQITGIGTVTPFSAPTTTSTTTKNG